MFHQLATNRWLAASADGTAYLALGHTSEPNALCVLWSTSTPLIAHHLLQVAIADGV